MTSATRSRATRAIQILKETWDEVDYANRRLLELRVGIPARPHSSPKLSTTVSELEALFGQEGPRPRD